jgi:hypothetical protein
MLFITCALVAATDLSDFSFKNIVTGDPISWEEIQMPSEYNNNKALTREEIGQIREIKDPNGCDAFSLSTEGLTFDHNAEKIRFIEYRLVCNDKADKSLDLVKLLIEIDRKIDREPGEYGSLDPDHLFHKMIKGLSKYRNFTDLIFNSEDLHKLVYDLELSTIIFHTADEIRNNNEDRFMSLTKNQINDIMKKSHSRMCVDKRRQDFYNSISDPIDTYTEMFLISHSLACCTVLPGTAYHPEFTDQADKMLKHFDFIQQDRINMREVLNHVTKIDWMNNSECRYLLYHYLERIYLNDDYLEDTKIALEYGELNRARGTCSYLINIIQETHDRFNSQSILTLLKSFS